MIALTHDFQLEKCGKETINYEVKTAIQKISFENNKKPEKEESLPKGFFKPTNDVDVASEDDESDWIDRSNINTICKNIKNLDLKIVACLSTDFSIQNVLRHMGINILSLDGKLITKCNTYILRCR